MKALTKALVFFAATLTIVSFTSEALAQNNCAALKKGVYFYRLNQTNGFWVTFRIYNPASRDPNQRLRHTVGVEAWMNKQPEGPNYIPHDGLGQGTLSPQGGLSVRVEWQNGAIGVYTARAKVSGTGFVLVDGKTFDEVHPNSRAAWSSNDRLPCSN